MYSCGVSLYVLLSGEFPFSRADEDAGATNPVRLQRELRRALAGDVRPLPQVCGGPAAPGALFPHLRLPTQFGHAHRACRCARRYHSEMRQHRQVRCCTAEGFF